MDTIQAVFKERYIVTVLSIAIKSKYELEMFGTPITEGLSVDETISTDVTTCGLTINELLEVYRKGYDIKIPDPDTTLAIYEAINDHLSMWDKHLTYSVNKKKAPTKDLVDLDEMAKKLFSHVKYAYIEEANKGFHLGGIDYDDIGMLDNGTKPPPITDIARKDLAKKFKSKVSIRNIDLSILG